MKHSGYLTTIQAADYLGISPLSLTRDRLRGPTIPFVRIGNSVRYRRSDLDAFVETAIKPFERHSENDLPSVELVSVNGTRQNEHE